MRIKVNMFFILFLFACFYTGYLEQAIIIFTSVILHELGHVYVAGKLKLHVEEIELFPFGGVARIENMTKYGGMTEAIVALAGPSVSLLIAMCFYFFSLFSETMQLVYKYNFLLFAFNITPVLPLDGGRILRNIMLHHTSYKQSTRIMSILGKLAAIILVVYNILLILNGDETFAFASVAFFMFLGAVKEQKYCSYYYLLNKNNKKVKAIKSRAIKKRIIKVHEDTYLRFAAAQFSPSNVCEIRVFDGNGKLLRILNEADIMDAIIRYGYEGKIKELHK